MLEVLLILVILIVILFIWRGSMTAVVMGLLYGLLGLLGLALAGMTVFFLWCWISLLGFRKADGEFVRFEHAPRFDYAVYLVDGKEYICWFPAETYGRARIYRTNVTQALRIRDGKSQGHVYDRHSLLIMTVGIVFCIGSILFVLWLLLG